MKGNEQGKRSLVFGCQIDVFIWLSCVTKHAVREPFKPPQRLPPKPLGSIVQSWMACVTSGIPRESLGNSTTAEAGPKQPRRDRGWSSSAYLDCVSCWQDSQICNRIAKTLRVNRLISWLIIECRILYPAALISPDIAILKTQSTSQLMTIIHPIRRMWSIIHWIRMIKVNERRDEAARNCK